MKVKVYAPNSVRYEADADGEKAYRCIYLNDEFVEAAPLCATKAEAEIRLHDLMRERGITGGTEPIWKDFSFKNYKQWKQQK